jgi:MFS family permease
VRLLAVLGPRGACLAALAVFSAGSVGCALALSMPWMLAGRTVQGLGGGLLAALSYGLIQLVFAQRLWPRAVALVSGMWGVATLCGPAVGGLFAQAGHWRWAFWFLLPVAAAQALLVLVQLRPSAGVTHERPAVLPRVPGVQIGLLAAVGAGDRGRRAVCPTCGGRPPAWWRAWPSGWPPRASTAAPPCACCRAAPIR